MSDDDGCFFAIAGFVLGVIVVLFITVPQIKYARKDGYDNCLSKKAPVELKTQDCVNLGDEFTYRNQTWKCAERNGQWAFEYAQ